MWGRLRLQDDVLYFRYDDQSPLRLVIPPSAASAIAKELHTELGHAGQSKTEKAARQRFWWPDMKRDVITACNNYALVKHPTQQARAPLVSIHSGYPNQRLGIDFVGPFPQSRRGNRYLLVLVDFFTKWAEANPFPNQEAVTVAVTPLLQPTPPLSPTL